MTKPPYCLQGFIKKKGLPNSTSVTRVIEGGEPSDFKSLFKSWPAPVATGKVYNNNKIGAGNMSVNCSLCLSLKGTFLWYGHVTQKKQ